MNKAKKNSMQDYKFAVYSKHRDLYGNIFDLPDFTMKQILTPFQKAEKCYGREYWVKHNLGQDADPLTVEHVSEDAPAVTLYHGILHQLFGLLMYMLDDLGGQNVQGGFPYYSHYCFGKDSTIYNSSELFSVLLSNVGVLFMTGLLWIGVKAFGWWMVLIFYGVPYLWLNHWMVLITFLQHTDGRLPHLTTLSGVSREVLQLPSILILDLQIPTSFTASWVHMWFTIIDYEPKSRKLWE
ncbi:hypothetical protein V8E51_007382 [Hyaloscypha variabilis]